jgi:uncharacterized membrane protein (UPF0127 family)
MKNQALKSWSRFVFQLVILAILSLGILQSCGNEESGETSKTPKPLPGTTFEHEGNLTFYMGDFQGDSTNPVEIKIEIAETEGTITQGLMNRSSMDFDKGMLFIFNDNVARSFWMKNTIISLDIIFIDINNKIIAIKERTTPYSEAQVTSNNIPAKYVLEVNAGFVSKHGTQVGNEVYFKRI